MNNIKRAVIAGLITGSAIVAQGAHAAIDVSSVTSALTDAGVACATVGGAALVVYVGIKVWHLVRRAM